MRAPQVLTYLSAPVLGATAVLLRPALGAFLLIVAFLACIAFSWFVVYENKAFRPGWRGVAGQFEPTATTKPSVARTGFFVTAWFMAGVGAGLLYVMAAAAA